MYYVEYLNKFLLYKIVFYYTNKIPNICFINCVYWTFLQCKLHLPFFIALQHGIWVLILLSKLDSAIAIWSSKQYLNAVIKFGLRCIYKVMKIAWVHNFTRLTPNKKKLSAINQLVRVFFFFGGRTMLTLKSHRKVEDNCPSF